MAPNTPGDGFLGWLGRQIGHVKKAIKTDVTSPAVPVSQDTAAEPPLPAEENKQVLYRDEKAEEVELPDKPGVILRRTTIDEVIVKRNDDEKEKA